MPEALESLVSDSNIQVQMDPWLIFSPVGENQSTGLILYPGGLVDPAAYAPAGREIARVDYLAIIPTMPLNLAVLYADQNPGEISGLATPEEVLESWSQLPVDTVWVPIEGGKHSQFGWYGPQDVDNPATIDRDHQQEQIVEATLALLSQIGK